MIAALTLALVAGVIGALVTTQAASRTSASAGMLDRAQARALAEHALEVAITEMGSGWLHRGVLGGPVDTSSTLEADQLPLRSARRVSAHVVVDGDVTTGTFALEAHAEVGAAQARASAVVRPHLSSDHALLLEHAAYDPALFSLPRAACTWPRDDARRDPRCIDQESGARTLEGPVHTNEGLALGPGVVATGPVTTSLLVTGADGRPVPAHWYPPGADAGATPAAPPPEHRALVAMPRRASDVLLGVDVTCRFRGPTSIRFDGESIRVRSPRSVPRPGEVWGDGREIGCMGVDRGSLTGFVTVHLPASAVIEVIRDDLDDCLVHPLGIGLGEDSERDWWCNGGDAFVWGRYRGARTLVAEDHVQIVWDIEPGDADGVVEPNDDELLGLVAGDSVVLRRPVARVRIGRTWSWTNVAFAGPGIAPFGEHPDDAPVPVASRWEEPRIVASLAALRGAVTIQNPFLGQMGTGPMRVLGSVAGRFDGVMFWQSRGIDGSVLGESGYDLEIVHDPRLERGAPPGMPIIDTGPMRVLEMDIG